MEGEARAFVRDFKFREVTGFRGGERICQRSRGSGSKIGDRPKWVKNRVFEAP